MNTLKKLWKGLAKVIAKHHLYAIADEIYSDLVYGVKHYSLTSMIPERTIFISGLSKSHAMTGYRLGYVAGPQEIMGSIGKMHAFLVTTVTDNVQQQLLRRLIMVRKIRLNSVRPMKRTRDLVCWTTRSRFRNVNTRRSILYLC